MIALDNQKLNTQTKELKMQFDNLNEENIILKQLKNELDDKYNNCFEEKNKFKDKCEVL